MSRPAAGPESLGVQVRLATEDDASSVVGLLRASWEFLAPWEPARPPEYFTEAHQRAILRDVLSRHRDGRALPLVILEDGAVVGRVNVNDVVRGAFQSAYLGYWVAQSAGGRGVATAAVAATVDLAFGELGLHRLQADTLVHNVASQRVLARNGFSRIGLAPAYMRIAGRWQDHVLHHLLNE